MKKHTRPEFRGLNEVECRALLSRNNVGRVAYALHSEVEIEPIHYVFSEGWLYGRTSAGRKLEILARQPWVAFEVDEVEGPFDWQSVVAHGSFHLLHDDGSEVEKETYARALRAIRSRMPTALTASDPVPNRKELFGIHIDRIDGRAATSDP